MPAVGVAADLELTGPPTGFDQLSVQIEQLHPQSALAEEIFGRVGANEIGQLQNALIYRRNGHIRRLAGIETGHRHRQIHGLARFPLSRRGQRDVQGARRGVQTDPGDADGPARSALSCVIGRAERGGGNVHARPPLGGNGQFHRRPVRWGADRLAEPQPVADHVQQHFTGERRPDEDLGGLTGLIARLIQRHLHLIRGVAVLARTLEPAHSEAHAGGDAVAGVQHVQPVIAPFRDAVRERRRLTGSDIERLAGHWRTVADHQLVVPAALIVVPVILMVLAHQIGAQPAFRQRLAQRIEDDHVETGFLADGDAVIAEARLNADGERLGTIGQVQTAADRPATRLEQRHPHPRLQRAAGVGRLTQRHLRLGLALSVGAGQRHREAFGGPTVLRQPEAIAGERGIGVGVLVQHYFGFGLEIGRRRAIQETTIDVHDSRFIRLQHRRS